MVGNSMFKVFKHSPLLSYTCAAALAAGCAPTTDNGSEGAGFTVSDVSEIGAPAPAAADTALDGSDVSMVYILENKNGPNHVLGLRRDPHTGRISDLHRYATGGDGFFGVATQEQHSVVVDQQSLYAVNPGSNSVSAFAIMPNGALRLLGTAPSGGTDPVSLAVHPDGYLYVANEGGPTFSGDPTPGSYSVLRIRQDGSLEPIANSVVTLAQFAHPAEILVSPDGKRLVASQHEGNVIDSFQIAADGRLVSHTSLPNQPGAFGGGFLPGRSDKVVFTLAEESQGPEAPGVASYDLPANGAPIRTDLYTDPQQVDPCWTVFSPDGSRLWTSAALSHTVAEYAVDPAGRFTLLSKEVPPDTDLLLTTDIARDRRAQFLYALRAFDRATQGGIPRVPHVQVFAIVGGSTNAGLSLVQDLTLPDDLDAAGIIGMAVFDRK